VFEEKRDATGNMARTGEKRGAYGVLLGKPEENTPLGRSRLRWEDNIKTERKEIGWEGVNLCDLAQEGETLRDVVKAVMHFRVA
jgi:hypothetical protein